MNDPTTLPDHCADAPSVTAAVTRNTGRACPCCGAHITHRERWCATCDRLINSQRHNTDDTEPEATA